MNAFLLALGVLLGADDAAVHSLPGTVKDEQGQPLAGVLVVVQTGYGRQAMAGFTTTNAEGTFELSGISKPGPVSQLQFFALKHGWGAAYQRFMARDELPERLDFMLKPVTAQTITLLDPIGKPVAGVEVEELSIIRDQRNGGHLFPPALAQFPFHSDVDGKIRIDILPTDERAAIQVHTEAWGRQRDLFDRDKPDQIFRLRRVGSIDGQVIGADGAALGGIVIDVDVRDPETPYFFGRASVTTDAAGKFRVAAIAEGRATVRVSHEQAKPVQTSPPVEVQITAGQTATIEFKLPRAVRVTGKVVDELTDEPIAGAQVYAWNNAQGSAPPLASTDKDGIYSLEIAEGQIGVEVREVPLPHYIGVRNTTSESSKTGQKTVDMPPLRVPRGRRVEGFVVDEQDRPVDAAWVGAQWWEEQNGLMTTGGRSARTDKEGRFVLEAVSSKVEVYLRADTPERAGTEYFTVPLDQKEPIRLTVSPAGVAVLVGRIVDAQKKPIPGASLRLSAGYRQTSNRLHFGENMREWNLKADAEGWFQSPEALPRHLPPLGKLASIGRNGYFLSVTAPGRLPVQQYAKIGPEGSPFVLPDIVLAREGRVVGRVIDRQGKPIAGVEVRAAGLAEHQPAVIKTAADGRFELKKVHPEAVFVFASHKDYAFIGAPLPNDGSELNFTMLTRDEAAAEPPLVPRLTTPAENLAALQKLLLPLWDKLDPEAYFYQRAEIWKSLAPLDPDWARKKLPELWGLRYRIDALRKLGNLDDAIDLVPGLSDAYERTSTLVRLAGDTRDGARNRQLLAEAAIQAKSAIEPARRLAGLALVAKALYDLGERDAAKRVIEENLPAIESLEAGFWRGHIAETVALFNVDKALELCGGTTDKYEGDRHPGNIARRLAASDPVRAEAIVGSLSAENQYRHLPAVCYHMAPIDLTRARRIVESAHKTGHDQRPYAFIVMAQAVNSKDPATARALLREASELLADMRTASIYDRQPFGVGLALAHASEWIDPAATREYFWRAASLARGVSFRVNTDSELDSQFAADAELAVLLKRYGQYPDIAARLVEPIFTCDKFPLHRLYQHVATVGMAVVDLDRAIDWVERYRLEAKGDQLRYIPQPWELMAAAIGGDDDAFWQMMHKKVFYLWQPGEQED